MSITELVSTLHLKDSITFTLNSDFLNHNFDVVRQCLLRVKDLEGHMGKSNENATTLQSRIRQIEEIVRQHSQSIHSNQQKVKELSANIGDEFMKKMYAIEAKTSNMYDFDETVRRLQGLNRFVLADRFNKHIQENQRELEGVWRLREDFDRYLLNSNFQKYKAEQVKQFEQKQRLIEQCQQQVAGLAALITTLEQGVSKVSKELKENNGMIREINFPEMIEKMRRMKEETEGKVTELAIKIKKKVSQHQLLALEKSMIDKLDKFLAENEKNKAEKQQTKDALLFLEKKINDIQDVIQKTSEQDKDALFSLKKWQCASCTKDLGKFEGKMGQYRPWSIFPCKELDPQKTGGFGYLNYIDKMAYKKGSDVEQPALERLSKTFYDSKEKEGASKRLGTTKGSNLITNYGSEERGQSLKDAYFKESERGGSTHRVFRVSKKETVKPLQSEGAE